MNIIINPINEKGLYLITGPVSHIYDSFFELKGAIWERRGACSRKASVKVICSPNFALFFTTGTIVSVLTQVDDPSIISAFGNDGNNEFSFSVSAKSVHLSNFIWTFSPPVVEREINIITGKIKDMIDYGDKMRISTATSKNKSSTNNNLFIKGDLMESFFSFKEEDKTKDYVFICGEKTLFKGSPTFSCFAIYSI